MGSIADIEAGYIAKEYFFSWTEKAPNFFFQEMLQVELSKY